MGRLTDNLENAKTKVANYEYELSEEVKTKKSNLGKELFDLLNNEDFEGRIDVTDCDLTIEGEYYDKYTDYYNPNCKLAIVEVVANSEECYVEDEDGNEYFFEDDLTLYEVESIVNEVKSIIEYKNEN